MPKRLPPAVTEIVPGALYAVSASLPASYDATWITPGFEGRVAVSCYVLRDGAEALVIDTGLSAHRDVVTEGLAVLIEGTRESSLIMSRREPDSIINLPWLIRRFALRRVYCGGILSPLDFFERLDQQAAEAHIHTIADVGVDWLPSGKSIEVGSLSLEVLRTTLCVLPKSHFYERRTRTLFGSDSWAFLPQAQDHGVASATDPAEVTGEMIARHLRHKFDWLLGIDTTPVREDLGRLLTEYEIERICSSCGAIIEGRELVRHVLEQTLEALTQLADEPMADRLGSFDAATYARAGAAAA